MNSSTPKTLLLTALLLSSVSSAALADFKEDFAQAQAEYFKFVSEKGGSFDSAWSQFEMLGKTHKNHPAVQVYMGSLETIKARDTWMPWKKLKWVDQGLERIDTALALLDESSPSAEIAGETPVALLVRISAARTFLGVPSFLNRLQEAKDVFADIQSMTDITSLDAKVQKQIYLIGLEIAQAESDTESEVQYQQRIKGLAL